MPRARGAPHAHPGNLGVNVKFGTPDEELDSLLESPVQFLCRVSALSVRMMEVKVAFLCVGQ